jgi:hypothetical protein
MNINRKNPLTSHNTFLASPADPQAAALELAARKFFACASATAWTPSADKVFIQLWNTSGKEA